MSPDQIDFRRLIRDSFLKCNYYEGLTMYKNDNTYTTKTTEICNVLLTIVLKDFKKI